MGDESRVLRRVTLEPRHAPTGFTTHRRGGDVLPSPTALSIVQFGGDDGFYLLYLDASGSEMTDTWHQSLEGAVRQAQSEFGVASEDWRIVEV